MRAKWLNLSIVLLIVFTPLAGIWNVIPSLAQDAPPPPPSVAENGLVSPGALAPSSAEESLVMPNCELLDDPESRGLMSGALETALIYACGRESELEDTPARAAVMRPQSPAALGNNVLVNDPTGEMTSMTQNGAVVAYNEDNGVLCAAYNDSYHGVVQGQGYTGFSSSNDGGASWMDRGSLNDTDSRGDPSLVWRRADGQFYLATLHNNGLGLWQLGADCETPAWVGMIHSGLSDDKGMLTVDNNPASPYYGYLYTVWTNYTDGHIYAARSESGAIWSTPEDLSGHDLVQGAWPAVDPVTSDVYVAWLHWDVYPDGPIDIEMARSIDGGASWSMVTNPMSDQVNPRDATATSHCGRPALNEDIRYSAYPQIAVDHNSNVHVVYTYDPEAYDYGDVVNVYYRRSLDQGASWEDEIRVNDTGYRDQFSPALAIGETGAIGVFWYDRRRDAANALYDRYMAISRDGGVTFEANQRISTESSPVTHDGSLATCYHGDYDGAAAGGGTFYTVWGDDRRGDADVWSDSTPYFWGGLVGTVYDANTLHGLDNALAKTIHAPTGIAYSTVGDASGGYALSVPGNEVYAVTAQVYGYTSNTVTATVGADGGRADIPLTPVSDWSISGSVLDDNTGYPVYAHVTVSGVPLDPPAPYNETWSDPFTGSYTLPHLAAGILYTLTFEATGYNPLEYFVGELNADLSNLDVTLEPDLVACTAPGYQMTPPCEVATGAVLQPVLVEVEGCPCETQSHELTFANHSGADAEVLLSYTTSPGVSAEMPATLGIVPDSGVKPFVVMLKVDQGVVYSTTVVVTVTASLASNPVISDTSVIEKRVLDPIAWEARHDSPVPSMDGAVIEYEGRLYNLGGDGSDGAVEIYDPTTDSWTTGASEPTPNITFPGDACFGYAAPDDPVILLLPDTYGAVSGVWYRYHIMTNTWDTPALPAGLPVNGIWAPDIIVDRHANQCYITGGASVVGGGDLTTLYSYDPVYNSVTLLGNFTHIPTGFDSHAGWYVPWIGAAGGICVGGGADSSNIAYADTQCYDIAAGTFNAPNADLGPLPEPWWGMADAESNRGGKQQLWIANGVSGGGNLIGRSAYFDQEVGEFVYGPDPVYVSFRGEGVGVQGDVYLVDGSAAGFDPTTRVQRLLQCPDCESPVKAVKTGPEWAYTGDVVSYTVVITRPDWLSSTVMLSDMLPPGVAYAGGLSASSGTAWYSDTDAAVYWTVQPVMGTTTPGTALEIISNTWADAGTGVVYNPETDFVRYVHEGSGPYFIHDVAYPMPHPVLHSFNLSDINPGLPTEYSGIGYDYTTGHYFLANYGGGGGYTDHIVEMDSFGRVINGWEVDSGSSYDGSFLSSIVDIAVVPGSPTRYFATRLFDGGLVYEIDLIKAGMFELGSWGTVLTCTVPGLTDSAGIDYDAQNGVLYHSDWDTDNVVVTDLRCNVLETFTCNNAAAGDASGITFVEGQWPPEVWVTDYNGDETARCEAIGNELLPEVVTVTFNVTVTALASTTIGNVATLEYEAQGATPSPAVLHLRTENTSGSVQRALDQLGYTYDIVFNRSDWTGIDFSPYDVVIIGMDGGEVDAPSIRKLRTDVIDQGKHLIILGGTSLASFADGVNQYLVANDTGNHSWTLTTAPHFTLLDAAHPLAQDLPITRDFVNTNVRYYQLRVTDPEVEAIAQNGDGFTSYFRKTYPGDGELVWFIQAVKSGYWSDPNDFQLLLRIIGNAMPHTREIIAEHAFHVAPHPAITWTEEVYVNGSYFGHPEDGPFTVSPGDDVQIVDRLDYVGHEPLFVQLDEDLGGYPVELLDTFYTHGAVLSADGDWAVTVMPGTSARLVKTLRVTDTVPVVITENLYPDGLPAEERTLALQPPTFAKDGPSVAYNGQLITYTFTYESQSPLLGSLLLTDALPAGVEFAGGLQASYGSAWYDLLSRSVYWRNLPSGAQTLAAMATTPGEVTRAAPASPSATWFEAAAIPQGVTRYAHAQCPGDANRFYVVSGVSGGMNTAAAWRYDAETNAWTALAPIPYPVDGSSAVCYQGKLYVAGGSGIPQFYIYDIARDTWLEGPMLPRPVWGAAMAAWDGRIYLAGGDSNFSIGAASDEVNVYDIALGAWIGNGATMPHPTAAPGWTQVGRYLYVVGGWSDLITQNLTSTLRYDIPGNYWEPGPVFTSARADFALAATGQYLYAIGGDADDNGPFDAVTLTERLDYTHWYTDVWTDINDPLPGPLTGYRGGFCTTAMSGGEIWSVGGLKTGIWIYTDTNQYRPSEPCVTTPSSVTFTFNVRVTAGAGDHVTNQAQLDDDGFIFAAETAFDVPMPDWDKQANDEAWYPGFRVILEVSDTLTVTDVVSTPSAFTLQESWDSEILQLTGYTTSAGTIIENPWQLAADTPFAYARSAAEYSYTTGKVYFLGGRTGAPTDGSIWEFDPATGVYTDTGVDMSVPISNYSIARLIDNGGHEVFVTFGGRTGSATFIDTVQGFYPESGAVSVFSSDPYPLVTSASGVAVVNNIAYVFGGFDGVAVTADTYIFDITAADGARWTAGPSLNQARGYIASAVVDGIIYAIGGDEFASPNLIPLAVVERLDPSAGTPAWDDVGVADLPFACDEMPAFGFDATSPYSLAGSIVVAGCGRWPDEYADALRYDVASDTWDVAFVDLNDARRNHAGTFIPDGDGEGMPGLWVWGGRQYNDNNVLSSVEVYPLAQGNLVWQVPYGNTPPATLTKVFRVLPGTWTQTVLDEELAIGSWFENRSVIVERRLPGTYYNLTIAVGGTGSGTVLPPVGTYEYYSGTTALITATAAPSSTFTGWSGDVSSASPTASVLMDGNKVVTATFMLGTTTPSEIYLPLVMRNYSP